jgi:acyl-coenzyme A thioesterase PaaI-like protein
MMEALRAMQNRIAEARPPGELVAEAAAQFERLAAAFAPFGVSEQQRVAGRRWDLPGRGQALVPPVRFESADSRHFRGWVTYGPLYLGSGGAAHGGAIPLLFDELMGKLANVGGRSPSRTAYLHVNYRALTRIGVELRVEGRIEREEGRKKYLMGALYDAQTLVADAEGLFVGARAEHSTQDNAWR